MNISKKKELAARALNVGKDRIIFNSERLSEIKEAITRQDIIDLHKNKTITIKEIRGRRTLEKKKRRKAGSIKKKPAKSKRKYITLTRKLRRHLSSLKKKGLITNKRFYELRKEIKASAFKNLSQLKSGGKK